MRDLRNKGAWAWGGADAGRGCLCFHTSESPCGRGSGRTLWERRGGRRIDTLLGHKSLTQLNLKGKLSVGLRHPCWDGLPWGGEHSSAVVLKAGCWWRVHAALRCHDSVILPFLCFGTQKMPMSPFLPVSQVLSLTVFYTVYSFFPAGCQGYNSGVPLSLPRFPK